jgi:hypothetical protein
MLGEGDAWGAWLGPLKWPVRAMIVLFGHVVLTALLITAIWGLERYTHWLYGENLPRLYGKVPLEWAFDTMDAGVLLLFIVWGLVEAGRELIRKVQ